MALNTTSPNLTPRLTASFGIFTSGFASLVLILIILEQLGLDPHWIKELIVALPVLFYTGIGVIVRTNNLEEFFVAGQKISPFYTGIGLTSNLLGGAGLIGLIGAFFFLGFDALPIAIGWCAGLALMSVGIAPYLRKTGAYSLPGFFGIRFSNRTVRLVAALTLFPAVILIIAAEMRAGQMIAAVFLPAHPKLLLQLGTALLVISVVFGGMRSLAWTQSVQFIVILIGIGAPLIFISIMLTNLPLPQLSYGGLLREINLLEAARGLASQGAQALSQVLPPSNGAEALTQPFGEIFGSIGHGGFLALTLCVMLGTAVLPAQAARASTPENVSCARRSFGWAAVLIGIMVLSIPAYAAFLKYLVLKQLLGVPMAQIPDWAGTLQKLGLISLSGSQLDPALGNAQVMFRRDTAFLLLPAMNNFPLVLMGLVGAAAVAAAMAAAGGQLVTAGNSFSNDIFYSLVNQSASPGRRLLIARLGMIACAIIAFGIANRPGIDPLRMLLWAFSITASTFFAPVALSIWWRGMTSFGALLGMAAGFAVTSAYIVLVGGGGMPWLGVDTLYAATLGVPLSFAAAIGGSLISPRPDHQSLALVNEMHIPSGETIHSRLGRLAARHKAPKP